MQKRGQFFLIAAIVIIIILLGLAAVYNSVRTNQEDLRVYDLSEEINYESSQVIQRGIFNSLDETELAQNVEDLSNTYAKANPESDIIVVYGSGSQVNLLIYNSTQTGEIGIDTGNSGASQAIYTRKVIILNSEIESGNLTINIGNIPYTFDLRPGQNFYIVLRKDKEDERVIAQE